MEISREKKESVLEKYLCWRAFLLALLGKSDVAESLLWYLRRKKEPPTIITRKTGKG